MRNRVAESVARGHLDIYATYKNQREDARTVEVDGALCAAYLKALDALTKETGAMDDRSVMNIARMPDVLVVTEAEEDQTALLALARDAMKVALTQLTAMREREGEALSRDMTARIDALEALVSKIAQRYPDTVREYEARLRERIEELIGNNVDEQRLLQEVAIMADRSAISEELVRLGSHIAQMREALAQSEPVGRRLDFIVQELNREVNTISSKSQDIPITQWVVAAKAEIEKLREQVQNVE